RKHLRGNSVWQLLRNLDVDLVGAVSGYQVRSPARARVGRGYCNCCNRCCVAFLVSELAWLGEQPAAFNRNRRRHWVVHAAHGWGRDLAGKKEVDCRDGCNGGHRCCHTARGLRAGAAGIPRLADELLSIVPYAVLHGSRQPLPYVWILKKLAISSKR